MGGRGYTHTWHTRRPHVAPRFRQHTAAKHWLVSMRTRPHRDSNRLCPLVQSHCCYGHKPHTCTHTHTHTHCMNIRPSILFEVWWHVYLIELIFCSVVLMLCSTDYGKEKQIHSTMLDFNIYHLFGSCKIHPVNNKLQQQISLLEISRIKTLLVLIRGTLEEPRFGNSKSKTATQCEHVGMFKIFVKSARCPTFWWAW